MPASLQVVQQIKPKEFAATQAAEQSRKDAMEEKRSAERAALENLAEEGAPPSGFPWKAIVMIARIVVHMATTLERK